jgi:CRP-like cAMP-binding protein
MRKIPGLHNWVDELPAAVHEALTACMQAQRYVDGEAIYRVGEEARGLYLIKSGDVRLCNYTYNGKQIQMVYFHAGDCFGEMGLIDELPRFNNAYAMGDVVLQVLAPSDFRRLYNAHPEISQALNRFLCRRLRLTFSQAEEASALTLKERLLRMLAHLGYSRGIAVDGLVMIEDVSHESLANMLGATRQSVSRELKGIEKSGYIELRYGKIVIPDLPGLGEIIDQLLTGEQLVASYGEQDGL